MSDSPLNICTSFPSLSSPHPSFERDPTPPIPQRAHTTPVLTKQRSAPLLSSDSHDLPPLLPKPPPYSPSHPPSPHASSLYHDYSLGSPLASVASIMQQQHHSLHHQVPMTPTSFFLDDWSENLDRFYKCCQNHLAFRNSRHKKWFFLLTSRFLRPRIRYPQYESSPMLPHPIAVSIRCEWTTITKPRCITTLDYFTPVSGLNQPRPRPLETDTITAPTLPPDESPGLLPFHPHTRRNIRISIRIIRLHNPRITQAHCR